MAQNKYIDNSVVSKFNTLLASEFKAERDYLAISIWADNNGYTILSDWAKGESADEKVHAGILMKYLTDFNATPTLPFIEEGNLTFNNILDVINYALDTLEYPLKQLYEKTYNEIDEEYPSCGVFLHQFLKIQEESVANLLNMKNILQGVDVNNKFEMLKLQKMLFKS